MKKKLFGRDIITVNNILLALILLVASFLRLYKIGDYMTFLGDEGRDMLVALHILQGDFTLLGPRASAGDFFLGPIYYYMITPFLWLFNYDPVGPAVMVALFGIATVFLVYWVGNKLFGKFAGLTAATLYAISPLVVQYSRSSWNPNPMPFFALSMMHLLYQAVKENSWKKHVIVGFLLGIAMQLHYLATFLAVIVAVFVLVGNIIVQKAMIKKIRHVVFQYFEIFTGFLIGFSPFLAFEIRHNFPNFRTIFGFIFENTVEDTYEVEPSYTGVVQNVAIRLFARLLTAFPQMGSLENFDSIVLDAWQALAIIIAGLTIVALVKTDKYKASLLATWLVVGVLLFGLYKREIHDYYLGFLFPLPFLLLGNLLQQMFYVKRKSYKYFLPFISLLIFISLITLSLLDHPLKHSPNKQKVQMQGIAEFILDKTSDEPFNFALVSSGNTDHAYRYFFELEGRAPVVIENHIADPQRDTVTDQLFVICEDSCSPLGHPLWEIAGFGSAEIEKKWKVSVVEIYKLVPQNATEENIEE